MKRLGAVLCLFVLTSCTQSANTDQTAAGEMVRAAEVTAVAGRPKACWSDAECAPDQNCECVESNSGNCESAGLCVPRDWSAAGEALRGSTLAAMAADARAGPDAKAAAITSCRSMGDLSFIPPGYHPVSARWELRNGQVNDMVCIAKTDTKQIRVLRWLNFALPAGYHTLYTQSSGVDTTFRGCSQWSVFQGQRTCMNSWPLYVMQKND